MMNNFENRILLEKRTALFVPAASVPIENSIHIGALAAGLGNLLKLGYAPSHEMFEALAALSEEEFAQWLSNAEALIKEYKGADFEYRPMYLNFPEEVMELDEATLFIDAIIYAWTEFTVLPQGIEKARKDLESYDAEVLNMGKQKDIVDIFTNLLSSNVPLKESDLSDVKEYLALDYATIPDTIPIKETCAAVEQYLFSIGKSKEVMALIKTPTDVLRFSQAIYGADITLEHPIFKSFKRSERKFMLSALDKMPRLAEEMKAKKSIWLKFGESVHPAEPRYAEMYPNTAAAFAMLRSGKNIETYNTKLEAAFLNADIKKIVSLLSVKPGIFARNLDRTLCLAEEYGKVSDVLGPFFKAAKTVNPRILWQLVEFYRNRENEYRCFAFKQQVYATDTPARPLTKKTVNEVCDILTKAIYAQYADSDYMGKVYIDPALKNIAAPLKERNLPKGFKTLPIGSKLPVNPDMNTFRAYIYWKNCMNGNYEVTTDVDLSASFMNKDYQLVDTCSYFELKSQFGVHSGDLRNAPIDGPGACEFIDIDIVKAKAAGIRYISLSVNMYSGMPFEHYDVCYMGFMQRKDPNAGKIFEPSTLRQKFHITGQNICTPYIIDLEEMTVLWVDNRYGVNYMAEISNNVLTQSKAIAILSKASIERSRVSLYELIKARVDACGIEVENKNAADIVYSMDEGITPDCNDELLKLI